MKEFIYITLGIVLTVVCFVLPATMVMDMILGFYPAVIILAALTQKVNGFFRTWPFLLLCVIGVLIGYPKFEAYDTFKDVSYFLIPVMCLAFGFSISKIEKEEDFLRSLKIASLIGSIAYIIINYNTFGLEAFTNARAIRDDEDLNIGFDSGLLPVIGMSICTLEIIQRRITIDFGKEGQWFLGKFIELGIFFSAITIAASRTYLIIFVIMVAIAMIPLFREHKARITLLILIGSFGMLINILSSKEMSEMFEKSLMEIDVSDESELNDNERYRGYEAKVGLAAFDDFNTINKVFGEGMGYLLNMREFAPVREQVPITHNGYVYILLKVGIFGLILIILWGFYILHQLYLWNPATKNARLLKYLSAGCIFALFLSNTLIWGIFNILNCVTYTVIGYTIALIPPTVKKISKTEKRKKKKYGRFRYHR